MNSQGAKIMENKNKLDFIEMLEEARHLIKPNRYRFILAEALVSYFYTFTKSPTDIRNNTNSILESQNIEKISLGFVRNIVEKTGEQS